MTLQELQLYGVKFRAKCSADLEKRCMEQNRELCSMGAYDEQCGPQSQIYDRGWVSLACFRSNFGGLVLGCMDSYDSNQIVILQGFSKIYKIFKMNFRFFENFQCLCTIFFKISQKFGILQIFVEIGRFRSDFD